MRALKAILSFGFIRRWVSANATPRGLAFSRTFVGLHFRNAVGLGAGFDKNALYLRELDALGFGFVEIGTVTPLPQPGNEKPRLFRLPMDRALINRMGFNNDGAVQIAERLHAWRSTQRKEPGIPVLIVGGNIGKNKATSNEDAWRDYASCFNTLFPVVDYFVVNVSSPNTPGLRALQERSALEKILVTLQQLNKELSIKYSVAQKPILLKIAPDLNRQQLQEVIDMAGDIKLDGMVISNTTISRYGLLTDKTTVAEIGAGGLSGLPVQKMATEMIKYVCTKTNGQLPVIGSGGVFTKEDFEEKTSAGAALVQVWTGFIYEGPFIVKKILVGKKHPA